MKNIFILLFVFFGTASFQIKQLTWVAIGDSITYLNEHPDEAGNRITKGYMTMVTERLSNIKYVNQGHNGWTSGGIAKEIDHLGLVKADVYSIFLGTNDWWQGRPVGTLNDYVNDAGNETIYGSFRIIVKKLRMLSPQAKIILITPLKRVDFVSLGDMGNNAYGSYKEKNGLSLEQVAKAIDSIGRHEHFDVVDLYHVKKLNYQHLVKYKRVRYPGTDNFKNVKYPGFTDIPFDPKKDEYPYPLDAVDMTHDGLHPSDKGYAVISKRLVRIMKKL